MDLDLTTLTDEDFAELEHKTIVERERRNNVATIPETIAQLRQKFIDGGGDPADLNVDSLTEQE